MVENPQNMPPSKVDVRGVFACMQCGGYFQKVAAVGRPSPRVPIKRKTP